MENFSAGIERKKLKLSNVFKSIALVIMTVAVTKIADNPKQAVIQEKIDKIEEFAKHLDNYGVTGTAEYPISNEEAEEEYSRILLNIDSLLIEVQKDLQKI